MMTPERGVVVAGRYTLERRLARGGMGSVWLARDRDLEIDVTVKFMDPTLVASPEMCMRFEREAKSAAKLRSQHVVQVLGYGVDEEMPYIAMELLKGESLAERLTREGRQSLPMTAHLLGQICKALRTAHEAGLVHRDLKPGNIFLALKDEEVVVKVLDFGIAKVASGTGEASAETATGVTMGSVHYMSPEQIRSSRQVDPRSDLWSVGVILYKLLTGSLPFPGTTAGDVMVRVCTDTPTPPSFLVPELPAQVDAFFSRAFAREPEQRFQSAQEMAEAFAGAASGPLRAPVGARTTLPLSKLTGTMPLSSLTGTMPLEGANAGFANSMSRPPMPSVSELEEAFQRGGIALPSQTAGVWAAGTGVAERAAGDTGVGTFQAVMTGPSAEARAGAKAKVWWPMGVAVGAVALGGAVVATSLLGKARSGEEDLTSVATSTAPAVAAAPTNASMGPATPGDTSAVPMASASPAPRMPATPALSISTTKQPSVNPVISTSAAPPAPKAVSAPGGNPLDRSD